MDQDAANATSGATKNSTDLLEPRRQFTQEEMDRAMDQRGSELARAVRTSTIELLQGAGVGYDSARTVANGLVNGGGILAIVVAIWIAYVVARKTWSAYHRALAPQAGVVAGKTVSSAKSLKENFMDGFRDNSR